MHPVILGGGQKEHRRIVDAGLHIVEGRDRAQEGALFGVLVGEAVLVLPAGAGQQRVEAQHVQKRHLADDRAPEVGTLGVHHAGQQPAIGAALNREMIRRGHAVIN